MTAVAPEDVDWEALSPEARWTLQNIAAPHALGLSYDRIAERLGISKRHTRRAMNELRAELEMRAT